MSISARQRIGAWEVTIEVEVTLPHIRAIRETLLEAFRATDHIVLDVGNVSVVDVSCLQLFCAVPKSSLSQGKKVSFCMAIPSSIGEALGRAGYSRRTGCVQGINGECLLEEVNRV